LILTLWPVEDETTTHLMRDLYSNLVNGQDKVVALQQAQCRLIEGNEGLPAAHPYYWAPFFLVGDSGPLLA
jgi:CHAT domain-containing protein